MTPYLLTHFQVEYTEHCLRVYLPAQERELDIDVVALMPLQAPGDQLIAASPAIEPVLPTLERPANNAFVTFKVDCNPVSAQFYLMLMISDEQIVSTTGRSVSGRPQAGKVRDAWLETVKGVQSSQIYGQFSHLHWESAVIAVPLQQATTHE
jgi:hypothetical protein